jgi:hypothetical protein
MVSLLDSISLANKTDRELVDRAESLHVGAKAPEDRMYLGVNKELLSYKQKGLGR